MKSVALILISVVIFFSFTPKNSQQTFWRTKTTPAPTLPQDPNAKVYQELLKIPSPEKTAQKILDNFVRFQGKVVNKRSAPIEDTVIVMDGSGSIGACQFDEGKKAMISLIEICEAKGASCRFAGVTFSSSARKDFDFLAPNQAITQMSQIIFPGGGTNTYAGLAKADDIFVQGIGAQRRSKEMIFLVTDGQSNIDSHLLKDKAKNLKVNVEIFVVAVGRLNAHSIQEMANVVSYPPDKHVFRVEKYGSLKYVFKLALYIVQGKLNAKPTMTPNPCR